MSPKLFSVRRLSLAVAAAIFSSPSVYSQDNSVFQPLKSGRQWHCRAQGSQWDCKTVDLIAVDEKPTVQPTVKTPLEQKKGPAVAVGLATAAEVSKMPSATTSVAKKTSSRQVASSTHQTMASLDWVPRTELSEQERRGLAPWASGTYIEPNWSGKKDTRDANGLPIRVSADHIDGEWNHKTADLSGDVVIQQGNRMTQGDTAHVDQLKQKAHLNGNIVLREPNLLITGQRITLDNASGYMQIHDAQYVTQAAKLRGHTAELTRYGDKHIVMQDATYTSCPPIGCNAWQLKGKTIELNPTTGQGVAKHAVLDLAGLPVFYWPYLNFPIDHKRHSGLLYPTMGYDSDNGVDYAQPYYFNLAPNYDATLTPRVMSARGLLMQSEFRYLMSHGKGSVAGAYLNDDRLKDENRNYDERRWFYALKHQQQFGSHWSTKIDYADASDKDYFRDFSSYDQALNLETLNQQWSTRYQGGTLGSPWYMHLNVQRFKNLDLDRDNPYNRLPQLVFGGSQQLNDRWKLGYLADYTQFQRDTDWKYIGTVPDANKSAFDRDNHVTRYRYGHSTDNELANSEGGRLYAQSALQYSFAAPYAYVRPSVRVRSVQYQLSGMDASAFGAGAKPGTTNAQLKYDTSPGATVPSFSVDAGLNFERSSQWGDQHYLQTLQPRLMYVYAPYVSGQEQNPNFDSANLSFNYDALWTDNRFTGYDRLPDANQLSLGLETRFLNDQGVERLKAAIGQIIYFQDRRVLLDPYYGSQRSNIDINSDSNVSAGRRRYLEDQKSPVSPIATELTYRVNDQWKWRNEWMYNAYAGRNDRLSSTASWAPDQRRVINLGYSYTNQVDRTVKDHAGNAIPGVYADGNINQASISGVWPVTNHWSAMGRWNYDITNQRNIVVMAGAEKESDAYTLRVLWRSYIDEDDDIDNASRKSGVFLQLTLKGLGSLTGSSVNSYLEQIPGYDRIAAHKKQYR